MLLATAPRPRIITHRIGGLSAIHSSDIHAVIWKRDLAPHIRAESTEVSSTILQTIDFVTLTIDPEARIQQQLRKAQIESRFLTPDIALLVTVFGELSRARRIRVRLGSQDEGGHFGSGETIRLICAYQRAGIRKRPSDGHVMVFRGTRASGGRRTSSPEGFFLRLDAVAEKV